MAELTETSVESRMLEIEQAAANTEAQARLSEIRSQLGLAPAEEPKAVAATAGGDGETAAAPEAQAAPAEAKPAEG